jgi:hypothetical protein
MSLSFLAQALVFNTQVAPMKSRYGTTSGLGQQAGYFLFFRTQLKSPWMLFRIGVADKHHRFLPGNSMQAREAAQY